MGFFDLFTKKDNLPERAKLFPRELAVLLVQQIKNNPQACSLDEIPQGRGRFGLDPSNPIPVYGIPSNDVYLSRLMLAASTGITWKRLGNVDDQNIHGSIDEYEIMDTRGSVVCHWYISPYHMTISNKCPEGFMMIV